MSDERPVTFQSNGKRMFGILHVPAGPVRDVAVLFLNAGTHNRAGPHRIYVKMARRLCEMGFVTLRIDMPGVGDSEGEVRSIFFDMHDAEDAAGALDFLTRQQGAERVAIVGICGGARCAVRLAAGDLRVHGMALWGLPIVSTPPNLPAPHLDGEGGDSAGTVTGTAARHLAMHWLKRGVSRQAWKDYMSSGRTVREAFGNALLIGGRFLRRGLGRRTRSELDFFSASGAFLETGRPVLFAYGEADAIPRQEFEAHYRDIAEGRRPGCEYAVIDGGDHTFTTPDAEAAVIERSLEWFERTYPPGSDESGSLSPGRRASAR